MLLNLSQGTTPVESKASLTTSRKRKTKLRRNRLVTRQHIMALISSNPSIFHSSQLGSIERFVSLEGCEYAELRSERVQHLEAALRDRAEWRATHRHQQVASKVSEGMDVDGGGHAVDDDEQHSKTDHAAVPPVEPSGNAQSAPDSVRVKRKPESATTPVILRPEDALQAELFPELAVDTPTAAARTATAGSGADNDRADASDSQRVAAQVQDVDDWSEELSSSSSSEDDAVTTPAEGGIRDFGRLGLWKALSSILESSTKLLL